MGLNKEVECFLSYHMLYNSVDAYIRWLKNARAWFLGEQLWLQNEMLLKRTICRNKDQENVRELLQDVGSELLSDMDRITVNE